ncbi:MAG: hypothetical protein BRD50_08535 [Bacteroidetes bacterium SW_11_45_7]|nr:MAG: hypothetical protein BRD50_08535 [Bacteroidetes bacterium SW_11_45_7]
MKWYSLILLIFCALLLWQCSSEEITSGESYAIHADTVLSTPNTQEQYVSKVVLENESDSVTVQPYIRWKAAPDLRSNEKIVNSIVDKSWSDKRKADSLYYFIHQMIRFKEPELSNEKAMHNPVKLIHSYGNGYCSQFAAGFANLCNKAGVQARVWDLQGHVVSEVYYNSAWHMYDPDYQLRFKDKSGVFVSVPELETNPSIIDDRIIGNFDAEWYKSLFTSTDDNNPNHYYQKFADRDHRIECKLYPNDKVVYDVVKNDSWWARLREWIRDFYIHEHYHDHYPDFFGEGTYIRKLQGDKLDTGQLIIDIRWPYRIQSVVAKIFLKPGISAGQVELRGRRPDGSWKKSENWQVRGNQLIVPCRFVDYNWRELTDFSLKIGKRNGRVMSESVDSIHIVSQFQFNPRVFLPVGNAKQMAIDLSSGNSGKTKIEASWEKTPNWAVEEKTYD